MVDASLQTGSMAFKADPGRPYVLDMFLIRRGT